VFRTLSNISKLGWLIAPKGLLEGKGIHKTDGNKGPPVKDDDDGKDGPAKVSKLDKIKEKLHIGKR
jgi:hypothetical protein